MKTSTAHLPTEHARKYLQQLCKHFGHKVPVEFTPTSGRIDFPFGRCELVADPAQIIMKSTAEESDLPKLEEVIGSHLIRFAFRETPIINWQPASETSDEKEGLSC